jgi:Domain of unknown function (DUF4416)
MGHTRPIVPVALVVAAFSRHDSALVWALEQLERVYGPIGLSSPPFVFNQTTYYQPTMGPDLRKQFLVFQELVALDCLPEVKLRTNAIEAELIGNALYPEERPVNLDPGILSLGKFQLATTKDQAHRIYLRDGIFAEVTLRFQAGAWEPWTWTYADYREDHVRNFLVQARDYYRERLRQHNQPAAGE